MLHKALFFKALRGYRKEKQENSPQNENFLLFVPSGTDVDGIHITCTNIRKCASSTDQRIVIPSGGSVRTEPSSKPFSISSMEILILEIQNPRLQS